MTPELVLAAARLADDLAGRAEQDAARFEFAFRLGYGHGYDIGLRHGHEQLAEWWRIDRFPDPGTPSYAELQKRRYPPDGNEWRYVYHRDQPCDCHLTHNREQPPPPPRPIRPPRPAARGGDQRGDAA